MLELAQQIVAAFNSKKPFTLKLKDGTVIKCDVMSATNLMLAGNSVAGYLECYHGNNYNRYFIDQIESIK
jgi:hypothetical protein